MQAAGLRDHISNSSSSVRRMSSGNSIDSINSNKDLAVASQGGTNVSSQGNKSSSETKEDEVHLNAVVELIELLISAEVL